MTHTELILTLASAVLHALWNFWLKGAEDRPAVMFGSGYIFLVVGAPLLWTMGPLSALWGPAGVYVILSAVIHLIYRALLAGTYDRSDLSTAYPVIRSAPILIALLAVWLLQERINPVGWLGIALTVGGIYVLYLPDLSAVKRSPDRPGVKGRRELYALPSSRCEGRPGAAAVGPGHHALGHRLLHRGQAGRGPGHAAPGGLLLRL